MKPLKCILVVLLMGIGATAMAQRRFNSIIDSRQRLQSLQLSSEQRIRLANLIRRQRMQFNQNQKELNEILTDKQKAMLVQWNRQQQSSDSTSVKH